MSTATKPARPIAATITLSKPLQSHEGEVKKIELREPTYGDYIDLGEIVTETMIKDPNGGDTPNVRVSHDTDAIHAWLVRLSGVDENILRLMSFPDGKAAILAVKRLMQGAPAGK